MGARKDVVGLMGKLSIQAEEKGEVVVIRLTGQADVFTSRDLDALGSAYLDRGLSGILIEASRLTYLDSATLSALLHLQKKAGERGGTVAVCGLGGEPRRVFELSGFDGVFPFYSTEAEGLAALT
ncbi:MAG TPA: STAS domain-containing protein [bacterium]|nr:STAS domain-containing protein [bacterium]HPJ72561.1 STAS domain-containing protein [bacterium]HPQ65495.1 STAS domain-containing protein [bacterium]